MDRQGAWIVVFELILATPCAATLATLGRLDDDLNTLTGQLHILANHAASQVDPFSTPTSELEFWERVL
jgi:hypothetical protein